VSLDSKRKPAILSDVKVDGRVCRNEIDEDRLHPNGVGLFCRFYICSLKLIRNTYEVSC
jgi:hypothetical protein